MYHGNSCFQLYMRGRELLGYGDEPSVTLVTILEKGVTIKTSWEKMMYTNASKIIINATEQMRLDTTLIEGAEIFHPDTTEELLVHLRHVGRYNDCTDHLQFVAITQNLMLTTTTSGIDGLCYVSSVFATLPPQAKRLCFWLTQRK